MKIVMNPNGTLTEIDPRTNKMLPIKPQHMKIVKLDMNKTHTYIQNDVRALEKYDNIYKSKDEARAFLSLSKSKIPEV